MILSKKIPDKALTNKQNQQLWEELAAPKAVTAFSAMNQLQANPTAAVALLKRRLIDPTREARIRNWINDLSSKRFPVRSQAASELEKQGEFARRHLNRALKRKLPLEGQLRIKRLLDKLGAYFTSPAGLRFLRAIEVLDKINNRESRKLLHTMTGKFSDLSVD